MEHLLTLEEVAKMFDLTEDEVLALVDRQVIPSYKVGGVYLRFKADQIEQVKDKILNAIAQEKTKGVDADNNLKPGLKDIVLDFFYFYDYYIFMLAVIIMLVYLVLKG